MRCLVTGGAGFIGSHMVDCLLGEGCAVTVLDDLTTGLLSQVDRRAAFVRQSVLEPGLETLCKGMDAVIHAAAQTSVSCSVLDPAGDALANAVGTVRVLHAAAAAGVRRFVYLSSAAVYGDGMSPPIGEDAPTEPSSPYGLSKLMGEHYVRLLGQSSGMEWVVLRLANVYGPRQSAAGEAGVVARWAAALTAGAPIALYGDGSQTRDFICVTDVARAAVLALEHGAGCTLNVGTGCETPVRDVLASLESLSGRRAVIRQAPPRAGDLQRSALLNTRAREKLGFLPVTPLDQGLAATLAWAAAEYGMTRRDGL